VTRLYSTLSAADMTVDPLFTTNHDLVDVSNVHSAERIIECHPDIDLSQANWRIELPQGGVVRGTPQDVGSWPSAFNGQPPNRRVLQLSSSGAGTVLADNSTTIGTQLVQYNDSVMSGVPMVDRMPTAMPDNAMPDNAMPDGPIVLQEDGCSFGAGSFGPAGVAGWGAAVLVVVRRVRRRRVQPRDVLRLG